MSDFPFDTTEEFPLLSKAPIAEAILKLVAEPDPEFDSEAMKSQIESKLPDYTFNADLFAEQFQIQLHEDKTHNMDLKQNWVSTAYKSKENQRVLNLGNCEMVLSELKPYTNWNMFSGEVLRIWGIYQSIIQQNRIKKIGLRYVNLVDVPDELDLREYLKLPPEKPEGLDHLSHHHFLHRDGLNIPDTGYDVYWTRTINAKDGHSLVIDIDVHFKEPDGLESQEARTVIDRMRFLKNKFFFNTLTDNILKGLK